MRSCPSRQVLVVALAIVLLNLLAAPLAEGAGGELTFTLADPRGDDHGDGTLVYPISDDMGPGDLDLISFSAYRDKDGTVFEATFARTIRRPTRRPIDELGTLLSNVARYGFYTFNIDVYIDIDRIPGSGSTTMLPGRRATIAPVSAWEKAICLTPRPNEAREELKTILGRQARLELKRRQGRVESEDEHAFAGSVSNEVASSVFFPTLVWVTNRSVRFFVPASFLGGVATDTWSYVVAVSGADIEREVDVPGALGADNRPPATLMIIPVGSGRRGVGFFGGGQEDDDLQPPLVDIIVPAGMTQEAVLKDYSLGEGRPVHLPGVVPADVKGK
jgi:hypothetical protein